MPDTLKRYSYLWNGSEPGWVLLKSPDLVGGCCVFNELRSALLHIEDEQVNLRICQHMKEMGCKEIDAMPKPGPVSVKPVN